LAFSCILPESDTPGSGLPVSAVFDSRQGATIPPMLPINHLHMSHPILCHVYKGHIVTVCFQPMPPT
jgi:hypothetical protein